MNDTFVKMLIEIVAILIQCTAYKRVRGKELNPLVVSMLVAACIMSMLLTSTAYGPVGLLILSIALLRAKFLWERC